jgi:origin recognition complex subunit 2
VTTFIPYEEQELDSLPEILSTRTGTKRSIKGALFVLQSLTSNARSIFKLLAEHQLSCQQQHAQNAKKATDNDSASDSDSDAESDSGACQDGLSHMDLFRLAQSRFLISNEQAFRTIMTEFLDHELVKVGRSALNGAEVLRIPFAPGNIKEIVSMMATM